MVKVFVFKFSLAILHFMDEQVELPKFTEEKRIDSHQVIMAKYSHDGKVLATVNVDYSISIWDSHDILVDTYELSFILVEIRDKTPIMQSSWIGQLVVNTSTTS